MLSSFYPLIEL